MRSSIFFIILILLFFIRCDKEKPVDHSEEVSIQVENHLSTAIDTFEFYFNTPFGEEGLLITGLEPEKLSDKAYFGDVSYYYVEKDDFFLIKKGRFNINEKDYFISNCFCDPDLVLDTLEAGYLSILVENIDTLRGNVEYRVFVY